jgi:alkaline phosphatase
LYVAHKKEEIQASNTLKALYLDPLSTRLGSDRSRKLNLLIDVKENYQVALPLLVQDLQPLLPYLSTSDSSKNLTISISGERPAPGEYQNYPNYIFFDDDLKIKHSPVEWKRVSLVSLPFDKISKWSGTGPIPGDELRMLKHVIDTVHHAGKPFRFWAAPDTTEAWTQQKKLGVDLIGTDKTNELAEFLRSGSRKK